MGGKNRNLEFVEYVTGYAHASKWRTLSPELAQRALGSSWLSGVPPSQLPRLSSMGNVSLDSVAEEADVPELVGAAGLRAPFGFCSRALFNGENAKVAAARFKSSVRFYFPQADFYESEEPARVAYACRGLLVAGHFDAAKQVILAADIHPASVEKINQQIVSLKECIESYIAPEIVRAWAQSELDRARERVARGERIRNASSYLRGLEYMAESGRLCTAYTLFGKKTVMPKFKPPKNS